MQLKDIVNISSGYPFRGSIPENKESDICAVQMKDIAERTFINWGSCVRTEPPRIYNLEFLKPGDVLFVARGNNNYAVFIDSNADKYRAVASPHFFILHAIKTVLPEYLVWFLNQEPCQRYFQRESEGTLTKSIRRAVLEKTPVALPDIDKQKLIVRLYQTICEEQKTAKQLIDNGNRIMNTIANDLIDTCSDGFHSGRKL